jgi:hypothetical protein
MTRIKSVLQFMPALVLAAALVSCGGSANKSSGDSTKMADTTKKTDTTKKAMGPALTAPFDVAVVTHDVKDYSRWRPVFDADSANRKAAGMENVAVNRGIDNPNHVMIVLKISDVAKAKAFGADPKLKETMDKAGVSSKPEMAYFHVLRFNPQPNGKQLVVVNHKVKDFDAWLKVFDGDDKANRAKEGFIDVALDRGIDDPNMVRVVFGITDTAKAKAAIASKKPLMEKAGVIGKPSIEYCTRGQ